MQKNIWVVMPAYNEGQRIERVLNAFTQSDYNLVIVDDCSKDNTSEIVRKFKYHLIRHPVNYGAGAALQSGNEYALLHNAEIIVHFDADGQMQIKDIPAVIAPIINKQFDVVFGSRFINSGKLVPWTKRTFIHKPAIILNYLLTGVKLTDAHCGFRALSRAAAIKCVFKQDRMAHATEILDLVRINKLRYCEVPVEILYHHYGQNFLSGFKIIKDLLIAKVLKLN